MDLSRGVLLTGAEGQLGAALCEGSIGLLDIAVDPAAFEDWHADRSADSEGSADIGRGRGADGAVVCVEFHRGIVLCNGRFPDQLGGAHLGLRGFEIGPVGIGTVERLR